MLILEEHFTRHLEVFASFASGMSWKRVYVLQQEKLMMFIQTMTLVLAIASQMYKIYHY